MGYDLEHTGKAIYGPMLTLREFKVQAASAVQEYFESGDADEVIRSILELKSEAYHCEMVKKMISLAMDKGPRERELTSRLLTALHPTPLADKDMEAGFTVLLDSLEDLRTDVPEAIVRWMLCSRVSVIVFVVGCIYLFGRGHFSVSVISTFISPFT